MRMVARAVGRALLQMWGRRGLCARCQCLRGTGEGIAKAGGKERAFCGVRAGASRCSELGQDTPSRYLAIGRNPST